MEPKPTPPPHRRPASCTASLSLSLSLSLLVTSSRFVFDPSASRLQPRLTQPNSKRPHARPPELCRCLQPQPFRVFQLALLTPPSSTCRVFQMLECASSLKFFFRPPFIRLYNRPTIPQAYAVPLWLDYTSAHAPNFFLMLKTGRPE